VKDDEPLVFHTGMSGLFPLVSEAIAKVLPVSSIRYVGFAHFEADECGALNQFLAAAPHAVPVASQVGAIVSVNAYADRPARALGDGEVLSIGSKSLRWLDAPHVPHGWDNGYLMELSTRTLFAGDLFTQGGRGEVAVTESDILGPSEEFRLAMDYFAHAPHTSSVLEKLAREKLGYVRPGETAYVVLDPPGTPDDVEDASAPEVVVEKTWVDRVWDFLTGADLGS